MKQVFRLKLPEWVRFSGPITTSGTFLFGGAPAFAEGVVQIGFNQRLLDAQAALPQGYAIESDSASQYVDESGQDSGILPSATVGLQASATF